MSQLSASCQRLCTAGWVLSVHHLDIFEDLKQPEHPKCSEDPDSREALAGDVQHLQCIECCQAFCIAAKPFASGIQGFAATADLKLSTTQCAHSCYNYAKMGLVQSTCVVQQVHLPQACI